MATNYLDEREQVVVIPSTSAATAAPTTEDGYICSSNAARTFLNYTGTVTTCLLRMWVRDTQGVWYRAGSTDDGTVLVPGSGDEARDWAVGKGGEFTFQVETIVGGGTVVVSLMGVNL